jgi:hypothetical protein
MLASAYLAALQKLCCTKPRAAGCDLWRRQITPALGGTKRENLAVVLPAFVAGAMHGTDSTGPDTKASRCTVPL